MTAKEFFALDLQPGERVLVQVGSHEPKVAVFNGYATRCSAHIYNFDTDLFPYLQMPAKNGGMRNISFLGKGNFTFFGLSNIKSVRRYYTPQQIEKAVEKKNEVLAAIEPVMELRRQADGSYGLYSVKKDTLQTVLTDEQLAGYLEKYIEKDFAL